MILDTLGLFPVHSLNLDSARQEGSSSLAVGLWKWELGTSWAPEGGWPQNQLLLRHMWDGVHLQGAKQPLEAGEASL